MLRYELSRYGCWKQPTYAALAVTTSIGAVTLTAVATNASLCHWLVVVSLVFTILPAAYGPMLAADAYCGLTREAETSDFYLAGSKNWQVMTAKFLIRLLHLWFFTLPVVVGVGCESIFKSHSSRDPVSELVGILAIITHGLAFSGYSLGTSLLFSRKQHSIQSALLTSYLVIASMGWVAASSSIGMLIRLDLRSAGLTARDLQAFSTQELKTALILLVFTLAALVMPARASKS